jgi:predicted RNase H-like HicB family nuclease
MRTVVVKYRKEADGTWIGSSPDVPGYTGHGETFEEARERTSEGLPWFAEEDLAIAHKIPSAAEDPTSGEKVRFEMTKATPAPKFEVPQPAVSGVASEQ